MLDTRYFAPTDRAAITDAALADRIMTEMDAHVPALLATLQRCARSRIQRDYAVSLEVSYDTDASSRLRGYGLDTAFFVRLNAIHVTPRRMIDDPYSVVVSFKPSLAWDATGLRSAIRMVAENGFPHYHTR